VARKRSKRKRETKQTAVREIDANLRFPGKRIEGRGMRKTFALDTKIHLKVRTPEGAHIETKGPIENHKAFGMYMICCGWGDSKTGFRPGSKAGRAYQSACRAFLKASADYYDHINTKAAKKKAIGNKLTAKKKSGRSGVCPM